MHPRKCSHWRTGTHSHKLTHTHIRQHIVSHTHARTHARTHAHTHTHTHTHTQCVAVAISGYGVLVFDVCGSNPCKNGGTCLLIGSRYECKCPVSFHGYNCNGKYYLVPYYHTFSSQLPFIIYLIITLPPPYLSPCHRSLFHLSLWHLLKGITYANDKITKDITLAVFLDLSKAFDTIDHDILVYINYVILKLEA